MDAETKHNLERLREQNRTLLEKIASMEECLAAIARHQEAMGGWAIKSMTQLKAPEQLIFEVAWDLVRGLRPHPDEEELSGRVVDHALKIARELHEKSEIENCRE